MPASRALHARIDYLAQLTGQPEEEIIAQAIEDGLVALCRKYLSQAYLDGKVSRAQAVSELGEDALDELDYARHAIEQDVAWGMKGE